MIEQTIKLRVSQIEKSFAGVKALDKIDFAVKKGTVHVVCGENGAGKSTLMKILDGVYHPDAGEIFIDEKKVRIDNPIIARKYGIAMIFQELSYVPDLTVGENVLLGRWPMSKIGTVDWKAIKRQITELLEKEDLHFSVDTKLRTLNVSDIQLLEILKAISSEAQIVIMDEPTSSLSSREIDRLFEKIKRLKENGVSIIYISHKMDEVFRIADEITVLRDGVVVGTLAASEATEDQIIEMMVGRKIENLYPKEIIPLSDELLRVENFTREGVFENISFHLRRNEIIGFAGLMGAGRTEIVRALFGLDPYDSGDIYIKGQKIPKIKHVWEAVRRGMVMVSEDRRRYGIVPMLSVSRNVGLASMDKFIYNMRVHKQIERELVQRYCKKMNVKAPSLETKASSLSGGNQQKVVLAKWMSRDPEILIVDEPKRGIDVGAKREIFELMGECLKEGQGILMVSSELPELISLCDRIYVISGGRISGELSREDFSQEAIMKLAIKKTGGADSDA